MKRLAALVPLLLGLGLLVPAEAAPARTPRLAGTTVISGVGSTAVVLEAAAFSLAAGPGAVSLSTDGRAAALLLVPQDKGTLPFGRHRLVRSLDVQVDRPSGCTEAGSCVSRSGLAYAQREGSNGWVFEGRAAYPSGRYVAYLVGEPGRRVSATIRATGLRGRAVLRASRPVRASLVHARAAQELRAESVGSTVARTRGPAGAFQLVWSMDDPTLPVADHKYWLCLDRYDEGWTVAPEPACAADARPAFLGGSSQGGSGNGGQSLSRSADGTGPDGSAQFLPTLDRGQYLARWRAARTGWAPAVGYVGLVLDYVRA